MRFTPDQQKAIDLHGDSLIVSAAAGSGKTAVLTERVVEKLCAEPPVPVESLMILTFTTAAAEEMRSRIAKKLRARLKDDRDNAVIRRQLSMLPSAQISTIHSACFAIVRDNFERLGLDPQLSIAEESQLALMEADVLSDLIDELYETMDTDPDAKTVIEAFFAGKDDQKLGTAITDGSHFLKKLPFSRLYTDSISALDITESALSIVERRLFDILHGYQKLTELGIAGISEFIDNEREDVARIYRHARERSYSGAYNAACSLVYKRFNKPKELPTADWKPIQSMRNELKEQTGKLIAAFLPAPEDMVLADRERELEILSAYLRICDRFNALLRQKRLEARTVSYNDLEQYTLELLIESYDGESIVKTAVARELSERYDEIIVDEYQDCNLVQELIFRALSREGKNIFTVGDVKQSIYRFRDAAPELFLERQSRAVYPDGDTLHAPAKIDLSCNFRSHSLILDFINGIFYKLMTPEHAIDYTDSHELIASTRYGQSGLASVDMTLCVTSDSGKNSATRIEAEAAHVARQIRGMIGTQMIYDVEEERERPVRAADIALIMRAPRTCGMIFELALEREGIACINNNPAEKYLDTKEVRDTLALLQAVDNPYNDIPLITAMHSDYFGFDANELGAIRAHDRYAPFYDTVKAHADTDKKTADFVRVLSELRTLTLSASVYGLITAAYEKTGILTRLSSSSDGDKKRANLMLLTELASGFEATRYRGLFAFVTYLIKLAEKDQHMPASKLRSSSDCVNLLSIHKSKGLEFPIVFFVNTTATIQPVEPLEVMHHRVYGAGCKIRDSVRHCEFSSLARNIIIEQERIDGINEYIRLLYVALTRAGSRLYISGALTAKNAVELITACDRADDPPTLLDTDVSTSFFKWMLLPYIHTAGANDLRAFAHLPAALGNSCLSTHIVDIDSDTDTGAAAVADSEKQCGFDADEVYRLITRDAPCDADIPAKLSVSEIKGMREQEQDCEPLLSAATRFKKPRFLQGGVTGADIGTATHKFLQFCDFEKIHDLPSYESERARLIKYEFITERDGELTDRDGVIAFLTSDGLRGLLKDYTLYKEERFMFRLPAREVLGADSDEPVVIQGVLDCLFVKDGRAVIVDYKTDRVKTEAELIDRYRVQLGLYSRAISINEGLSTEAMYIYSFALKKFIQL